MLDSPPELPFDRLVRLGVHFFDVPIAAVSIVDESRIWFKARYGVDTEQVERHDGLCASGILRDGPLVLQDTRADRRAAKNPLVADDPGIRFYAGAPLQTPEGFGLGMLCIADYRPRLVKPGDIEVLSDLASLVMDELELRLLRGPAAVEIVWQEPPPRKVRPVDDWLPVLGVIAARPGVWAKLAHYDGETSAYRAAAQLRSRLDLPPGEWEFAARRSAGGSDLFARLQAGAPNRH